MKMKNKTKNNKEQLAIISLKLGEGKYLEIQAKFPILLDMNY